MVKLTVIVKTHNSQPYMPQLMKSLQNQTRVADEVILMDSASKDPSYLIPYKAKNVSLIIEKEDVGFCRGNNIAYQLVREKSDYVLFLNPDAFLSPNFLEKSIQIMELQKDVGALTGTMLGFDIEKNLPRSTYDSTGIFQKWYGRWYDRDQGEKIEERKYVREEYIPAICGALFFCRNSALKQIIVGDGEVFDNTFFMYKEDIDLSIRLRNKGWHLLYSPELVAYHCRGWNPDRTKIPRRFRLHSAENELKIHAKQKSPYFFYSLLKYAYVRFLDR